MEKYRIPIPTSNTDTDTPLVDNLLLHLAACFTQSLLSTVSHSPIKRFARLVAHTRAKRITATQWTEMYEQRVLYVVLSDCKLSLYLLYGLSFMIWWTNESIGRRNLEFCVLYETHCSSFSNESVQAGHNQRKLHYKTSEYSFVGELSAGMTRTFLPPANATSLCFQSHLFIYLSVCLSVCLSALCNAVTVDSK